MTEVKPGDVVRRKDPPTTIGKKPSKGKVLSVSNDPRPIKVQWESGAVGWYRARELEVA